MPEFTCLPVDRRRFLVLMGGAAACAAVGSRIAWAARDDTRRRATTWTLSETPPPPGLETARGLIGAAILAPSFWNTQPWRFEVDGGELRLTLDPARTLPESDPDQRFTHLSLGAALENLLIACRAWGLQPTVQYLPWGPLARRGTALVAARISWQAAESRRDRANFGVLATRRSNPRLYDGRAVTMQHRTELQAQVSDDLRLHWLEDRADLHAVAAIAHDAVLEETRNRRAQAERFTWLRASDRDERRSADGMTADQLGMHGPLGWFAARALDPTSHLHGWGASSLAHSLSDAIRSSGALALLSAPRRQDTTALVAGQAYQRLALTATALGLAQQPLASPIALERHRAAVAKRFGAAGEEPLLLVRLGHAHPVEPTPRRAVALVSTYRNS